MCVAVVVESNEYLPASELQAMARANPDGGGVAWVDGDLVHYRKGLTWQDINALQAIIPRPFLLHFRIATKGGKIPELTHPFPTGMQAFTEDLIGSAKSVIIHNGTWSAYESHVPPGIDKHAVSDTQIAAYVAGWDERVLDEVRWSNAIMKANNGRADITLRGDWQEYNGNLFSNVHWQNTWTAKNWTTFDSWAEEYERRNGKSRDSAKERHAGKHTPKLVGTKSERKAAKRARRDARKLDASRVKGCLSGFCREKTDVQGAYECIQCGEKRRASAPPVKCADGSECRCVGTYVCFGHYSERRPIASTGTWCAECNQRGGAHLTSCSDSWASERRRELASEEYRSKVAPTLVHCAEPSWVTERTVPQSDDTSAREAQGDGAVEDMIDLVESQLAGGIEVSTEDLDAALAAMMIEDERLAREVRAIDRADAYLDPDKATIEAYLASTTPPGSFKS